LAFSVVVELIAIGPAYSVDEVVGSLPLVVYRMVAPTNALSVTVCGPMKLPAAGLAVGAASVPKFMLNVLERRSLFVQLFLNPIDFNVVVVAIGNGAL
jgi:hypothetical protein